MTEPTQDGEIPLLDADRLDDHDHKAGDELELSNKDYGTAEDTKAILSLIAKLKETPSGANSHPDEIEDRAIALYARFCEIVLSPDATEKQLGKISDLTGEDTSKMRQRLLDEDEPEEGGASALLRALS